MEKGFKFKWDSGRKSCLVPHLAQPTSLNITRYNHFSTTLSTFSFLDITRQSYFLQLLWIFESFFSTTCRNFQTFPIVIRAVLSLFSEYVQFSFKLVHFSAFQIQINHGENIEFVDNKTLCIASAMAVLCNTLLCSVLAIFLQKQKIPARHGLCVMAILLQGDGAEDWPYFAKAGLDMARYKPFIL